jgi:uncharacterized membrane protein YecN with MAPEG domain
VRIVPLYAALLALIFVALSMRTIRLRQRLRVAIGDGGHETLRRAARAHSNFAEYVPLALLLLFFVESAGASAMFVHALCASLLAGRLMHALGVSRVPEPLALRAAGIVLTFIPIVAAALRLLAASFSH